MKKMLIAVGIIAAIILIAISGVFEDETPPPSFTMGQGPGTDIIKPLSVACSPDAGYDFCYTNTYGAATATIQTTNWLSRSGYGYIDGETRQYYIDEVYVNVKYRGDRLYTSRSSSWISCSSSSCSASTIPAGKVVLETAPASSIRPIQFSAWDKFTSTSGAWWYSYVQFGWLSSTSAYVIGCYDNNDCDSGTYCDKSGSWDTWSCEIDTCEPVTVCEGRDLYTKECFDGELRTVNVQTNSVECGCLELPTPNICDGFDLWSQRQFGCMGTVLAFELLEKNSVECGCIIQEPTNTCIGYDLWSQKQTMQCVEGLSKYQLLEEKSTDCGYICTSGETKSYPCTDGTPIITQRCIDNDWEEVEPEVCPLNWINLEMILQGYIEDIQLYLEKLL